MGEYKVSIPEMNLPEGMTDDQAYAIWKACEMRRFAYEFEYQMNINDEEHWWVEAAKAAIEDGEITGEELVEEAFRMFWDKPTDFEGYFANALDRLI